ncbi:DUF222 domain-containing protein [Jatrophihabitans sp. DSM 45814]
MTDIQVVSGRVGCGTVEDLSLERLQGEICALVGQIETAGARLLILVGELDARADWLGVGIKSCAHWLAWRCHLSPHAAREQVRVARRLRELPAIRDEFGAGRLSYAKVRALSRVATIEDEGALIAFAHTATAAQVERTVSSWRRCETLDESSRAERRRLTWREDEHGMIHLTACLDSDEGAAVLAALDAVARRLSATGAPQLGNTPPAPPARPTADALVALARSYLGAEPDVAVSQQPGTELVVHLDAEVLLDEAAGGRAAYESGATLTHRQIRRLACESRLLVIVKDGRQILDVGRSTRTVPTAMRRALTARDGGCAVPACTEGRARKLHAHHVWHWADGGPTNLDNLVLVCTFHHRAIHRDGLTITIDGAGGFAFRDEHGQPLEPVPIAPRNTDPLPEFDAEAVPRWGGERFDLDYITSTLLASRAARKQQHRADETAQRAA